MLACTQNRCRGAENVKSVSRCKQRCGAKRRLQSCTVAGLVSYKTLAKTIRTAPDSGQLGPVGVAVEPFAGVGFQIAAPPARSQVKVQARRRTESALSIRTPQTPPMGSRRRETERILANPRGSFQDWNRQRA